MKHLSLISLLLFTGMFFKHCKDYLGHPDKPKTALITTEKEGSVDDIYLDIKDNILAKGLNIVAEVNHGQAAQSVGIDLRPTRLIIFGNPAVGTQLMQSDQRIGIDLPLKVLVYEQEDGQSVSAYYNASFWADNYNIDDKENVIQGVNQALADITASGELGPQSYFGKDQVESLQVLQSDLSVDDTYDRIKEAIVARPFTVIAEVNHSAAAASVGLDLRPTRLIVFGNPQGGSLLMSSNQEIGIDLPLKILVWEDEEGNNWVGYYKGSFFAKRYQVDDQENVVNNIDGVLEAITAEAVQ